MYKKLPLISICFLSCSLLLWICTFCIPSKQDMGAYEKLVEAKKNSSQSKSPVYQTRQGVVKDIWFSQDSQTRLHHRLESQSSVLTLMHTDKKIDILEVLQNFNCWIQDKISISPTGTTQQVRFFTGDEGTYRYSTQKLLAQSVKLSLYRLPGQDLPSSLHSFSPFLHGIAQDVSFAISDKTPKFHAENFKASVRGIAPSEKNKVAQRN